MCFMLVYNYPSIVCLPRLLFKRDYHAATSVSPTAPVLNIARTLTYQNLPLLELNPVQSQTHRQIPPQQTSMLCLLPSLPETHAR